MKSKPRFIVRPSIEEDAATILKCLAEAFAPYKDSYTEEAYMDTVLSPETLKHRMKSMKVFVAEERNGVVVGTIACNLVNAEEGHLRGMAVLPSHQGAGIAQKLLERAEANCLLRNVLVSLWTQPHRSSVQSAFMKEMGFELLEE